VSSVNDGMYGPKHGKDTNMKHVKPLVTLQGHETYQSMNPQNFIIMTNCFNGSQQYKDAYDRGNDHHS